MEVKGAMEVGLKGGWEEEENKCKWKLSHEREVANGEMEVNEEWPTIRQQHS